METEPRRMQRLAAYALCIDGETILLSRIAQGATAASDGMWTLPGGGIEFGEDPRDAAIRELSEESGLIGEIIELVDVNSMATRFADPRDGEPVDFHGVRIIYRMRVVGGELRDEIGGSSDTCAWVSASDLDRLPLVELARIGARLAGLLP